MKFFITPSAGLAANAIMFAAALGAPAAQAQESGPPDADSWHFNVGAGVASQSRYSGSHERKLMLMPTLGASYGRWSIGAIPGAAGAVAGVGYSLLQEGPWRIGLGIGTSLKPPRMESDSTLLTGLGDISRTTLASASVGYNAKWFGAHASVMTDVGDHQQGTQAALDVQARYSPMPGLMLSAGPGLTWADSRYMQTYYGIDAAQSTRSGKSAYTASGGLNSVRFGVGAQYQLTQQWTIGAKLDSSSLRGDAAKSPITVGKLQTTLGLSTNYRF